MNSSIVGIIAILSTLILSGGQPSMGETASSTTTAAALFVRFETVFRADTNLISIPGEYRGLSQQDANGLRVPFAYLNPALDSLQDGLSRIVLDNADEILVGTKDYHAPKGLGSVRSLFCYAVVLKPNSRFSLQEYVSRHPDQRHIWSWSAHLGEFGENDTRPSQLYATQVTSSYLLVSNDKLGLLSVVRLLTSHTRIAEVLLELPEWEHVRQHEVWGYRRYRHTLVSDRQAAGLEGVTRNAQYLIFFVNLQEKLATLHLYSSVSDDPTSKTIDPTHILPPLILLKPGFWETKFPLTGDKESYDRMLTVIGLFGFGIYT